MDRKSPFATDVVKLAGGAAFAQAFGVLIAPVLSRLYEPGPFGTAAVFTAILGIVSLVVALHYETAIVLPEEDHEASALLVGSLCLVGLFGLVTTFAVTVFGDAICRLLKAPDLAGVLYLLPAMVLARGICQVFQYWNTRLRRFGLLSIGRVGSALTRGAGKLAFGAGGWASAGTLVISDLVGNLLLAGGLALKSWMHDRPALGKVSFREVRRQLSRYRKFPLLAMWSSLLNAVSFQLPALLLCLFFDKVTVGYYSMAAYVIGLPLRLVGRAIGQVLYQRASVAFRTGTLADVVMNIFDRLLTLVLYPLTVLALIGPDILAVALGEPWREAGVYARILSPWQFFVFVGAPLATLLNVLGRQELGLAFNAMLLLARAVSLIVGGWLGNVHLALMLFAGSGSVLWLWFVISVLRVAGVPAGRAVLDLLRRLLVVGCAVLPIAAGKWLWHLPSWGVIGIACAVAAAYYGVVAARDEYLRSLVRLSWRGIMNKGEQP